MKAVKIDTHGKAIVYDGPITLKVLQEAVGGFIEPVGLHNGEDGAIMYLNEEGKLQGLQPNPIATFIVEIYSPISDIILGDVILVGPPDSEGEDTSISDSWIKLFNISG